MDMKKVNYQIGLFLIFFIFLNINCDNKSTEPNTPPNKPSISPSSSSVNSGENVNITASATDPDGNNLTYLWSSTGGSFNITSGTTVTWTAPTVTITQIYTVTVEVKDSDGASASNFINITVNPSSSSSTKIEGNAIDEAGSPINNMKVVAVVSSSSSRYDSTYTNSSGNYSLSVAAGTYNMSCNAVVGTKFLSNDRTDQVTVSQGQTATYDIDAKEGYFLEITNVNLNGSGNSTTVTTGASISLTFDYTAWSRVGCPSCIDWIPVGIEGDAQVVHSLGIPGNYPGSSGNSSLILTAPSNSGSYQIYAKIEATYTEPEAIQRYESGFPDSYTYIPIGMVNVQ